MSSTVVSPKLSRKGSSGIAGAVRGGRRPQRAIGDFFGYRVALLARINDRIGQFEVAAPFGMTLGDWRVLAMIHQLGGPTPRQVARQCCLDEGQVSRSVKKLVKSGLIERSGSAEDRRSVRLVLSAAGAAQHAQMRLRADAVNQPANYGLDAGEFDDLMRLLDRVLDHLRVSLATTGASGQAKTADHRRVSK